MSLFQLLGAPLRAIQQLLSPVSPEEKLERLEERDWRRRILLASRRVQHVHLSMEQEFAGMREFQKEWSQVQPALEGLSESLAASQALLAGFQETLDQHGVMLRTQAEASAQSLAAPPSAKFSSAQGEVEETLSAVDEIAFEMEGESWEAQVYGEGLSLPEADAEPFLQVEDSEDLGSTEAVVALDEAASAAFAMQADPSEQEQLPPFLESQAAAPQSALDNEDLGQPESVEVDELLEAPSESQEHAEGASFEAPGSTALDPTAMEVSDGVEEPAAQGSPESEQYEEPAAAVANLHGPEVDEALEQGEFDQALEDAEFELDEDVFAILESQEVEADEEPLVASCADTPELACAGGREAQLAETLATERERSLVLEGQLQAQNARARQRIQELEAELASSGLERTEDQELSAELGDTSERLEAQLDELQELVMGMEIPEDVAGSSLGDVEPREQRILELEQLNEALQVRLEAAAESARQNQELEDMREKLRNSEMKRLELESRHNEELVDFADHTRGRLSALEKQLQSSKSALLDLEEERAKIASLALLSERALHSLSLEHEELKAKRRTMAAAAKSLGDIQSVLRRSAEQLEPETTSLTQLMGDGGGERIDLESEDDEQASLAQLEQERAE